MELYRDAAQSIELRTADLLDRMTLDEKVAQLGSVYADELYRENGFSNEQAARMMRDGIGHISAIGRTTGLTANRLAALANQIQRYLLQGTRLGIPAIIHEECLNGFRARGATIFPQNIGLAAAWDRKMIEHMTSVIRRQMRAAGVHQGLAPVLDVARDPRWGRTEETFGEDPFLVSEMGLAYIRGLQGETAPAGSHATAAEDSDILSEGVAATVKHFAGHGLPEGGLNCAPAHIPPRLLWDVYLYPFEKAIKEAGALSLMNAYHELDGLPCGASGELLTAILRDQWGFSGLVVSDYYAIAQLVTVHQICQDIGAAAGLALEAGIDLELPRSDGFAAPLKERVAKGLLDVSLIDRAVRRVLRLKFKLGLFEQPLVDAEKVINLDTPEDRQLALEAARRSIVLLKNENNRLPLQKNIPSIAIIGPNADSLRNLLGDYTYPAGAGYELTTRANSREAEVVWKDREMLAGRIRQPQIISVLEGIRAAVSSATRVLFAPGCELTGTSTAGFPEAVKIAAAADVAVVVTGGCSGMLSQCTSGEMRDSLSLALPGVQAELIKTIRQTGTPLVLVIISGRPHALGDIGDQVEAIIEAWLPGEEGGRAVADVIFGDFNPGGKLPLSLPVHSGQVPVYYSHKPSGGHSSLWGDYSDGSTKPLYEFGFGLSYTTFSLSDLEIQPGRISTAGAVHITCDVTNTGRLAGDEVVQLYIHDEIASLTRPVRQLKGFERVHLLPGQKHKVVFLLPAAELAFSGRDFKPLIEPGVFRVLVGNSSQNTPLEGTFEVHRS